MCGELGGGRSSVQLSWSRDPCSPRAGALVACRVGPLPPGGRVRQNRRPEDLLGPQHLPGRSSHLHGVSWGPCLHSDTHRPPPPVPAVAPQSAFFTGFPCDLRKPEVWEVPTRCHLASFLDVMCPWGSVCGGLLTCADLVSPQAGGGGRDPAPTGRALGTAGQATDSTGGTREQVRGWRPAAAHAGVAPPADKRRTFRSRTEAQAQAPGRSVPAPCRSFFRSGPVLDSRLGGRLSCSRHARASL